MTAMPPRSSKYSAANLDPEMDAGEDYAAIEDDGTNAIGSPISELRTLRERNLELVTRISRLRAENKQLSQAALGPEDLKTLRHQESQLNHDFARLATLCDEQERQIEEDRQTIEELQTALEQERAGTQFLARHVGDQFNKHKEGAEQAARVWACTENELKAEIQRLTERTQTLEAHLSAQENAATELRNSLANHQALFEASQADFNRKLAKLTDDLWAKDLELERLMNNEAVLTGQLLQLNQVGAQKAQQILETQRELAEMQKKVAQAESEAQSLRAEAKRQAGEFATLQTSRAEVILNARSEFMKEIEALRSENAEFRNRLGHANEELSRLRVESADFRGQIRNSQDEVPRLKTECAELRHQLRTAQEQSTQMRDAVAMQQLETQHAKLEAERQIASLKSEHVLQIRAKETEISTLKAEQATEAGRLRAQHGLELRGQQNEFETLKEGYERKIARLTDQFEVERENARASHYKLSSELSGLRAEMAHASATHKAAQKEAQQQLLQMRQSLEEQIQLRVRLETRLAEVVSDSKRELERFHATEIALRTEVATLTADLETRTTEIASYSASMQRTETAHEVAEKTAAQFRSEAEARSRRIEELMLLCDSKDAALARTAEQTTRLQKSIDEQTTHLEKANQEISALRLSLQEKVELKSSRTEQTERTLSELSGQLQAREQQLRQYAQALTKEKSELTRFAKQIAAEIQMVSATHPLKDYLTATDFELSKVEVQLKTTPTLSPDRARLEACVSQLVEQREFLKMILGNAQKQFEGQIHSLEKLVSSGKLAAVPPPPPSPFAAPLTASVSVSGSVSGTVSGNAAAIKAPQVTDMSEPKAASPEERVHWQNPTRDLT